MVNRSFGMALLVCVSFLIGCGMLSGQSQDSGTPTLRTEDVRSGGSASAGDPAAEIVWLRDFDSALSQARPGQVIFVDVYTDWCSWCKHMDRNVFSHPSVRAVASRNVFVKIDAEDGGKGEAFARANGVSGFPTLIVFSPDGKKIATQPGAFRQPSEFVRWFDAAAERIG